MTCFSALVIIVWARCYINLKTLKILTYLVHKDLSTKETKFWFNQKYNMHKKEKPSWSQAY